MSLVEKTLIKLKSEKRPEAARVAANPDRVVASPDNADGGVASPPLALPSRTAVHSEAPPLPIPPARKLRLDRDRMLAAGWLPPESQEHEIASQFRAIKRPLLRRAFDPAERDINAARLIMLASALPGDGKTFTCVNLALSMSLEKDSSILLVDGDVAKPQISRMLGIGEEPGLLDVLAEPDRPIESVVLATDIPNLSIMPAGKRSDIATELLASARMHQVVAQLAAANTRRIVLFDSPPILLTSEARVLAALMGQVVVVVKAGQTPQAALTDTLSLLGPEKAVSLVLNQADTTGPLSYYYGHNYGYEPSKSDTTEGRS